MRKKIEADPDSIFVVEDNNQIVGTVSTIDDGRVAWLFRFAVLQNAQEDIIANNLEKYALNILKQEGHTQVLVYAPVGNEHLNFRYNSLGFTKGGDYTCYWKEIS